jgi:hypothetical protein
MPHLPPAHHETSKRDSPNETKIKVKQMNHPGFEFKPRQVNDSSQSNHGTDHLVSQSPPWWVHWQQKHKVWDLNPRPHEAQLEDQKPTKSSRRSSKRRKVVKASRGMKSGKAKHNGKKGLRKAQKSKKSSKSTQKLKINTPPEINSP